MKRKGCLLAVLVVAALVAVGVGALAIADRGRPPQFPAREKLFPGVVYTRTVRLSPRPLMIHVVTIDTKGGNGIRFLVTPPDDRASDQPLRARTTSQFLQEFDMQLAINGDGFSPWWSN